MAHVAPEVWAEMKKYLKDADATATAYEYFAPHMKEIYKPPT